MQAFVIVGPGGVAADRDGELVLDLAGLDPPALTAAAGWVGEQAGRPLRARMSGLADPRIESELAAVMPARPPTLFLPAAHGREVCDLGGRLAVHEAELGLPDGATRIVAVIGSALGLLNLTSFVGASPRLAGLAWDADALAAELGSPRTTAEGRWSAPLAQARGLVRLAAAAAGIDAIDADGAEAEARDGFAAILRRASDQSATVRR